MAEIIQDYTKEYLLGSVENSRIRTYLENYTRLCIYIASLRVEKGIT